MKYKKKLHEKLNKKKNHKERIITDDIIIII